MRSWSARSWPSMKYRVSPIASCARSFAQTSSSAARQWSMSWSEMKQRGLEPQRLRIAQRRRHPDLVDVEEIPHHHEDEIVLIAEQPQQETRIVQEPPELDADHQPAAADVDNHVGVRRHQAPESVQDSVPLATSTRREHPRPAVPAPSAPRRWNSHPRRRCSCAARRTCRCADPGGSASPKFSRGRRRAPSRASRSQGVTPSASQARNVPVRPMPVWISSAISGAPRAAQSAAARWANSGVISRTPPSP